MAARTLLLASALALGLTGLAQAQARSTWQEPERRGAEAGAPHVREAQARDLAGPRDRDMGPPSRDRDMGPPPRERDMGPPPRDGGPPPGARGDMGGRGDMGSRDMGPPPRGGGPPPREGMDGPPPRGRVAGRPGPRFDGERPRTVRSARYRGGAGSTWKTGRNSHGFQGSYGGCSYSGFAGPNGYKLNRNC